MAADGQPSGGKQASSRLGPHSSTSTAHRSGRLLEQRLLANPHATWLERTEIDAVLSQRQLQSLLGAAAINERANIGRLLKADILVLLASPAKPDSKSVNLVVCETAYGLRLAAMTVPIDKPESDVALLESAVDRPSIAIARRLRRLWPFRRSQAATFLTNTTICRAPTPRSSRRRCEPAGPLDGRAGRGAGGCGGTGHGRQRDDGSPAAADLLPWRVSP